MKGDSKTPVKAENGISSPASEKKKGKEEKEAPIKAPAKKRAKTEVKEIKKEEDDESEKSEDEEDEDDEESPKRKSGMNKIEWKCLRLNSMFCNIDLSVLNEVFSILFADQVLLI